MEYNFSTFEARGREIVDHLKKEFAQIRTGQASPNILDGIMVDSYGIKTPIAHMASISILDPKTLLVSPYDASRIREIEGTLQSSNLGLSISVGNEGVRVIFPELTEESRNTYTKLAKEYLEKSRVVLKVEREKEWSKISDDEKSGAISEDDKFRHKDKLQEIVAKINKNLEDLSEKKMKEVSGL